MMVQQRTLEEAIQQSQDDLDILMIKMLNNPRAVGAGAGAGAGAAEGASSTQFIRTERPNALRASSTDGSQSGGSDDEDVHLLSATLQSKLLTQTKGLPAWREMRSWQRKTAVVVATLFAGVLGAGVVNAMGGAGGALSAAGFMPAGVAWAFFAVLTIMLGGNYANEAIAKLRGVVYSEQGKKEQSWIKDINSLAKRVRKLAKQELTTEQGAKLMRAALTWYLYTRLERELRASFREHTIGNIEQDGTFHNDGRTDWSIDNALHNSGFASTLNYLTHVQGTQGQTELLGLLAELRSFSVSDTMTTAWIHFEQGLIGKLMTAYQPDKTTGLKVRADSLVKHFKLILLAVSGVVDPHKAEIVIEAREKKTLDVFLKGSFAQSSYVWAVEQARLIHEARMTTLQAMFKGFDQKGVRLFARKLGVETAEADWADLDRGNFSEAISAPSVSSKRSRVMKLLIAAIVMAAVSLGAGLAIIGAALLHSMFIYVVVGGGAILGAALKAKQVWSSSKSKGGFAQAKDAGNAAGWANALVNGGGTLLGTLAVAKSLTIMGASSALALTVALAIVGYFSGVLASASLTRGATADQSGSLAGVKLYQLARGNAHWLKTAWKSSTNLRRIAIALGVATGLGLGVFGWLACSTLWPSILVAFGGSASAVPMAVNVMTGILGAGLGAITGAFLLAKFAIQVFDRNTPKQLKNNQDITHLNTPEELIEAESKADAENTTTLKQWFANTASRYAFYMKKHPVRGTLQSIIVVGATYYFAQMIAIDAVQSLGMPTGVAFDALVVIPCFVVFGMMFAASGKWLFKPESHTTGELLCFDARNEFNARNEKVEDSLAAHPVRLATMGLGGDAEMKLQMFRDVERHGVPEAASVDHNLETVKPHQD